MEEYPIEETAFRKNVENHSFSLKRKTELLRTVFGLPRRDTVPMSVENMPAEFLLPEEILTIFREILKKDDSDRFEYCAHGDVKNDRLFFSRIKRGEMTRLKPIIKDAILSEFGLRRVLIHSHPEWSQFSSGDIASFLLTPIFEVFVLMATRKKHQTYDVLIGVKGQENLPIIEKSYLSGLYFGGDYRPRIRFLAKKLERLEDRPLDEVAALFQHNGCALYGGEGDLWRKEVRVFKFHPRDSTKFEQDRLTGLMLPKDMIDSPG